jgi:uncharacterized membrane protein YqaE (UPF0057 family)
MDAREYLARKGLDTGRDRERPNTLEEKAWERARGAGGHRPRAGTPHDWEEWEQLHDALAADAERIGQKIDSEAHRHPLPPQDDPRVGHFTPAETSPGAAGSTPASSDPRRHPGLRAPLLALAVLLPPLSIGLSGGGGRRVATCLLLTLLGWLPGVVHALRWLLRP